jgi:orotate phosphoribosyltransferase
VLVDREEGGREEITKYISDVRTLFTKTELLNAYKKARSV